MPKYTNPARGILDFCKQKFCWPLLCRQWTRGPQSADFSGTERKEKEEKEEKEEQEHGETIKGPPPGGA